MDRSRLVRLCEEKSDEDILNAGKQLSNYNPDAAEIIKAEMVKRGIKAPTPSPVVHEATKPVKKDGPSKVVFALVVIGLCLMLLLPMFRFVTIGAVFFIFPILIVLILAIGIIPWATKK